MRNKTIGFLDASGAYSFCGLVDGKYKLILSPSSKTKILFELPFEVNGDDIDQSLLMSKNNGIVDIELEGQPLYDSILAQRLTKEELLLMPLNPQANSWGVYDPGVVMPAMNQRDLWVLGAMPQTIGYRYNDYAFRQPVTGGPLAPFDIGGLNQLVIHSGGLSAAHSYGGGSMIQWLQRRLPEKAETQLALHWQPEDTNFLQLVAATMGPNQRSRCIRDPIGEKALWLI